MLASLQIISLIFYSSLGFAVQESGKCTDLWSTTLSTRLYISPDVKWKDVTSFWILRRERKQAIKKLTKLRAEMQSYLNDSAIDRLQSMLSDARYLAPNAREEQLNEIPEELWSNIEYFVMQARPRIQELKESFEKIHDDLEAKLEAIDHSGAKLHWRQRTARALLQQSLEAVVKKQAELEAADLPAKLFDDLVHKRSRLYRANQDPGVLPTHLEFSVWMYLLIFKSSDQSNALWHSFQVWQTVPQKLPPQLDGATWDNRLIYLQPLLHPNVIEYLRRHPLKTKSP